MPEKCGPNERPADFPPVPLGVEKFSDPAAPPPLSQAPLRNSKMLEQVSVRNPRNPLTASRLKLTKQLLNPNSHSQKPLILQGIASSRPEGQGRQPLLLQPPESRRLPLQAPRPDRPQDPQPSLHPLALLS